MIDGHRGERSHRSRSDRVVTRRATNHDRRSKRGM
jgi:hypothetical protein